MTKRLTIALVAVALFVLLAVMPVSAMTTTNPDGRSIDAGAIIFIGEEHLNLTHALNGAYIGNAGSGPAFDGKPTNLTIGWWASAAAISTSAPSKTINLQSRYLDFQVAPADFVGYTGNWYPLASDGTTASVTDGGVAAFNVQDPSLTVGVWDFQQAKDVTGLSVPQGEQLGVLINTNLYAATYSSRNNTLWTQPAAGFPAVGTGYTPMMPDGSETKWGDYNWTGQANGSYVYKTYADQASTSVWQIRNYTNYSTGYAMPALVGQNAYSTTNANPLILAGGYAVAYWNNSAVDDNYPWTGKNFTTDKYGIASFYDAQAAGTPDWWPETATILTPDQIWAQTVTSAAKDGFITLKVKDENGATLDKLYVNGLGLTSITKQFVDKQPWYFGSSTNYWVTDAVDSNNQYIYPVGTYSLWAESVLNNMKDNYKNAGSDFTGKTVSPTGTITLVSNTVKIEANKDSVVRSKSFSVTVTGKPSTTYYIWIKGTSALKSGYDDQPPMVKMGQEKVYTDPDTTDAAYKAANPFPIGNSYQFENGGGDTVRADVATDSSSPYRAFNSTRYYALINTSTSGVRTVEFTTNNWTKAQKYTIRVEQGFPTDTINGGSGYGTSGGDVKSDEVDINVEKGAVTIVAAGDQSYYLGEEIKFSGTNTETYKTFLFLVGPNLPDQGAVINDPDPRNAGTANPGVTNGQDADFKVIDVNGDNTWSWKWGTAGYALDAGTYTIYAVSQPYDRNHLANAAYGTVSVIIKKPFVSATASQSTVAKGDRVYVSGTAEGDPSSVAIWVMGKNYAIRDTASVNSDASFKYEIKQETTKTMSSGQYFVVVQHPMQNKQFDVDLYALTDATVANRGYVYNKLLTATNTNTPTKIFKLLGSNSLQGSDAAEALAQGINDANVDDTYTKLQFLVEEPVIRVDAIGDKHVGDKFTITAQTNLAVDDEVLVQVYSSSIKPTQKSQSGEISGATGTVKVVKGDSGMNKISFDVDSSTFKPDEYIVTEDAVIQEATGTALFNVLETSAQTVAPTQVVTAAPTTQVVTQAPTTVATTVAPTATPTKSPGFGALIALIGLGAVAFVVVRRH